MSAFDFRPHSPEPYVEGILYPVIRVAYRLWFGLGCIGFTVDEDLVYRTVGTLGYGCLGSVHHGPYRIGRNSDLYLYHPKD